MRLDGGAVECWSAGVLERSWRTATRLHVDEFLQPFRLTKGFCVVWALLLSVAVGTVRWIEPSPWYSACGFVVFVPFLATFVVYCPVRFFHLAFTSGARGRRVLRFVLAVVLANAVLHGVLLVSGCYTGALAGSVSGLLSGVAVAYFKSRSKEDAPSA